MKNHHLRKNRYVQIEQNGRTFICQLASSNIELLPQRNFDIFNIPVECIRIKKYILIDNEISLIFDTSLALLSAGMLPESIFIPITKMENDINSFELYVILSKLQYADEKYKELFQKMRGQG